MERNPGTPAESNSDRSEKDSSDSSTKKKRRITAAGSSSSDTKGTQPTQEAASETSTPKELSAFEQALARLATEKTEAEARTEEAPTHDKVLAEPEEETPVEEEAVEAEGQTVEEWADHRGEIELPLEHIAGGEMVIDLSGEDLHAHDSEIADSTEKTVPTSPVEYVSTVAPTPLYEVPAAIFSAESQQPTASANESQQVPSAEALQQSAVPAETAPLTPSLPETRRNDQSEAPAPVEASTYFMQPEAQYVQQHMVTEHAANAVPAPTQNSTERPMSKSDFDDALYRATKTGQNRGVLTGLLVGGGYEHFKHKRREKRVAKRHAETTKKLAEARKDFAFNAEQQVKQRAEYTRQAAESDQRFVASERRVTALEQQRQVQPAIERQTVSVANAAKLTTAEHVPQPVAENEQLAVAPEHRLQTSSWHSIEVDAHTGRVVENPAFQYGHEYYREQAQENALGLPPTQNTAEQSAAVTSRDTATTPASFGGSSLPPMYVAPQQSAATSVTPSVQQQAPQPKPVAVPKATKVVAKPTQPASPVWPLIVALVVVVICLSLALR